MQADTLPNACRKYKGLFGLPYSQKEITAEKLPLDPIDGELIGAFNAKHLKLLCERANIFHFLWIGQLFAILFPAKALGWCGWTGEGLDENNHCKSDGKFHHQFAESCNEHFSSEDHPDFKKKTIFIYVTVSNYANRIFHRFFTVPKGNGTVARLITSCKAVNKFCRKCELLRFPSIGDLFRILAFFTNPWCATSDYRHWFFQIPLPAMVRKLFSVHSENLLGELQAWPMGFSWSPFTAQSISMCICALAIIAAGFTPSFPEQTSLLPPFWIVKDTAGATVAFIIVWYDNILTVAGSKIISDMLIRHITAISKQVHAILKVSPTNPKPFTQTKNTVDFVGLTFHSQDGIVSWNHLPTNRERWEAVMHNLDPTTKPLSWRQVSEILGICIWDWWVSGENRSQIKLILRAAQLTGKLCSVAADWDKISSLSPQEIVELITYVTNVAKSKEFRTRPISNAIQSRSFTQGIFIIACSDAMAIRGAGITFTPEGTEINHELYTWNLKEAIESINWRETAAAIRTILWILSTNPGCKQILLGVDNSTAFAALSRHIFATDEKMQQELDEMFTLLESKGVAMFPCQIPGIILAADEPSRLLAPIKEKMIACAELLLNPRDASWWECLRKRSRGSL